MKTLTPRQIKRAARSGIKRAWKKKNNQGSFDQQIIGNDFLTLKKQRKVFMQIVKLHNAKNQSKDTGYFKRKESAYKQFVNKILICN